MQNPCKTCPRQTTGFEKDLLKAGMYITNKLIYFHI